MRKDVERKLARNLFVMEGLTAKEVATKVGVNEATIGRWRNDEKWDDLRLAEATSNDSLIADLKGEIRNFIVARQNGELSASKAADGISKLQKVIATLSAHKVSLEQYIHVMTDIFKHLQKEEPKLFQKLLDFQDNHLVRIAKEIG